MHYYLLKSGLLIVLKERLPEDHTLLNTKPAGGVIEEVAGIAHGSQAGTEVLMLNLYPDEHNKVIAHWETQSADD